MTQQHDAPEGGAENRVDLGPAKYDFGRKLNAIVTVSKTWEDAAERAAALFAPTPPAPSGLVDAVRAYRDAVYSLLTYIPHLTVAQPYRQREIALREAINKASATLDATLSGQQGGAVPAGDLRIAGLDLAIDIADHWHQRLLTLAQEAENFARQRNLKDRSEGAKQVLDEIKAERARLAEQPAPAGTGADGVEGMAKLAEARKLAATAFASICEARGYEALCGDPSGLAHHLIVAANALSDIIAPIAALDGASGQEGR